MSDVNAQADTIRADAERALADYALALMAALEAANTKCEQLGKERAEVGGAYRLAANRAVAAEARVRELEAEVDNWCDKAFDCLALAKRANDNTARAEAALSATRQALERRRVVYREPHSGDLTVVFPDYAWHDLCAALAVVGQTDEREKLLYPFDPDWLCLCGHMKDAHPQQASGLPGRCEGCDCRTFRACADNPSCPHCGSLSNERMPKSMVDRLDVPGEGEPRLCNSCGRPFLTLGQTGEEASAS